MHRAFVRSDDANVEGKKTVSKPQRYSGNNRDKSRNQEVSETIVAHLIMDEYLRLESS